MKVISNFLPKNRENDASTSNEPRSEEAVVQLWRSSLLTLSEAMPLSPKQISEPHRRGIRQLVDDFPNRPAPTIIEHKKAKTAELLKSYGSQMGNFLDSQEREAKAVLGSVAQLTEALAGLDQRHGVRLQGITKKLRLLATSNDLADIRAKLSAEVNALEKCLEEQQRDTRAAVQRLTEDVRASETRRQKAVPGSSSDASTDGLLALDRAVSGWDRYCLVRYEFRESNGSALGVPAWEKLVGPVQAAIPERMGHTVRSVALRPGILIAAVSCQLLEYAGQAESMEKALSTIAGAVCSSRVVEPLRGENLREALGRLERVL